MRIDQTQTTTAADLVNALPEGKLAAILTTYGEERAAKRLARAIARERAREPIRTTHRLAGIVAAAALTVIVLLVPVMAGLVVSTSLAHNPFKSRNCA